MGGKAFLSLLPHATFPRMPPKVYHSLKHILMERLHQLYKVAIAPPEAPEKLDYGDLDFLVAEPRREVSHDDVRAAISAAACIPMDGNRTSNYAIAFSTFANVLGPLEGEKEAMLDAYFQVDVHVCDDLNELEAINFMHSYGDMGMILGVIARGIGLQLGTKGLRVRLSVVISSDFRPHTLVYIQTAGQPLEEDQPPSYLLSSDFTTIAPFFGLSFDRWRQGFATREAVYDWVLSSRFTNVLRLQDPARGANQRRDRTMYHAFFDYARTRAASPLPQPPSAADDGAATSKEARTCALADALVHFGCADEFAAITARRWRERARREVFTSAMVRAWTGLASNDWRAIKRLMDLVRAELGGEDAMLDLQQDEIKDTVVRLRSRAQREVTEEWEQVSRAREAAESLST